MCCKNVFKYKNYLLSLLCIGLIIVLFSIYNTACDLSIVICNSRANSNKYIALYANPPPQRPTLELDLRIHLLSGSLG